MNQVVYEIPDDYKNIFVGFYIFGWLFLGKGFSSYQPTWTWKGVSKTFPIWINSKLIKVSSTFALDHFDLFGLRQGLKMGNMLKFAGSENFVTLFHYKLVRHPIMTGFFIMFWSVPVMTMGKFTYSRGNFTPLVVIIERYMNPRLYNFGKHDKATFFSQRLPRLI